MNVTQDSLWKNDTENVITKLEKSVLNTQKGDCPKKFLSKKKEYIYGLLHVCLHLPTHTIYTIYVKLPFIKLKHSDKTA